MFVICDSNTFFYKIYEHSKSFIIMGVTKKKNLIKKPSAVDKRKLDARKYFIPTINHAY